MFERMHQGRKVADEVMSNDAHTKEQRHGLISVVIHDLATFIGDNEMYLDRELTAHCMATFMGAEEVLDEAEPSRREQLKVAIWDMDREAKRMIKEDAGVAAIEKLFKKVAKPTLSGPFIDLLRRKLSERGR